MPLRSLLIDSTCDIKSTWPQRTAIRIYGMQNFQIELCVYILRGEGLRVSRIPHNGLRRPEVSYLSPTCDAASQRNAMQRDSRVDAQWRAHRCARPTGAACTRCSYAETVQYGPWNSYRRTKPRLVSRIPALTSIESTLSSRPSHDANERYVWALSRVYDIIYLTYVFVLRRSSIYFGKRWSTAITDTNNQHVTAKILNGI